MAIMCRRQTALLVLFLALYSTFRECHAETRCDAICNYDNLREQCDRCRLRVPMRFGKRSSPPEEEILLDSPDFFRQLKAADDLSSQFLQYLSQSMQRRSSLQNGGLRAEEEDLGQPKRRAIARMDNWSANSMGMIRKKRTTESDGWLWRAILARQRHLLVKPKDLPSSASDMFHH